MSKKNSGLKAVLMIDPTLPYTPIEIDGKTYKMCFDLEAIGRAEEELMRAGYEASLLMSMVQMTFSRARIVFAVSLHVYHPELDFEECKSWVTPENISYIVLAIGAAWKKNAPEPDEDDGNPHELAP